MSVNRFATILSIAFCALATLLGACSGKSGQAASAAAKADFSEADSLAGLSAAFSADSAFAFARAQVEMGPRVPGSQAHARCTAWLADEMARFGADTVLVQRGSMPGWDGKDVAVANVFARFNPSAPKRVLLLAHYDTRPWADRDADEAHRHTPIDGANDGASGVAVLLEIARCLGEKSPAIGVDFLFADAEDSGTPDFADNGLSAHEETWCLGTQYFADHLPYDAADMPAYGILLDMVGGRDARFHREYFSSRYASAPTAKVWDMARRMGLVERFPQQVGGGITDDHLPLIRAGIPTTDIIENYSPQTGSFNPTWHTVNDNIENLDPAPMADAGRVVLSLIYSEK